jgi:hypothetical protein
MNETLKILKTFRPQKSYIKLSRFAVETLKNFEKMYETFKNCEKNENF